MQLNPILLGQVACERRVSAIECSQWTDPTDNCVESCRVIACKPAFIPKCVEKPEHAGGHFDRTHASLDNTWFQRHYAKAKTPLVRFVVDLLYNRLYDLSYKLWICCGIVVQLFDLLWTSQTHTPLLRFVVNWVHNKSTTSWLVETLWICCGFVLDMLYNLYNKSTTNRISAVWA
jgi:hypothetical protein